MSAQARARSTGDEPRPAPDPKRANLRYHDAAACGYDAKWSISFDQRCIDYVRERAERMLPDRRYGRVLEVGAGTGFFLLNLWQAGFVEEAHACDISPGMLAACGENARRLGIALRSAAGDAESLPYGDGEFDLVVGHAFLHHLPDPAAALREMRRVLRPGGAVLLAGEPTRLGDRIAGMAKRAAAVGVRLAGRVRPGLRRPPDPAPATEGERAMRELEHHVDLHTFEPREVGEAASAAGFTAVRVETEELVSSLFGWAVRTIEAGVRPGALSDRWAWFAYRNWLRLSAVDRRVLARVVPRRAFYNLLLYGERPAASASPGTGTSRQLQGVADA
ncbi:MAG TPA: class I SAM-dependent methyltransferase [Actinomycetota bacterium]